MRLCVPVSSSSSRRASNLWSRAPAHLWRTFSINRRRWSVIQRWKELSSATGTSSALYTHRIVYARKSVYRIPVVLADSASANGCRL